VEEFVRPVSLEAARLLLASYRVVCAERGVTAIGSALFLYVFQMAPELQYTFGYNHTVWKWHAHPRK
jgi:hypothetical protein